MNRFEEWLTLLSGFFFNVVVVCFTVPLIGPILRGADIREARPELAVLGILAGILMLVLSVLAISFRRW